MEKRPFNEALSTRIRIGILIAKTVPENIADILFQVHSMDISIRDPAASQNINEPVICRMTDCIREEIDMIRLIDDGNVR